MLDLVLLDFKPELFQLIDLLLKFFHLSLVLLFHLLDGLLKLAHLITLALVMSLQLIEAVAMMIDC
jgi:hypothetical protein